VLKSQETGHDEVKATRNCRWPVEITPPDLPDLVTFADMNDPKSVMLD
jgi:hypothetical protein